eukprot:15094770-Alexandrium_andersonii.AAC.1
MRSDAENSLNIHPPRPRPGVSASFCALNPMVTTKQVGGRAGRAFRRCLGFGGGGAPAPPGRRNGSDNP